jgi:hypothetical protein
MTTLNLEFEETLEQVEIHIGLRVSMWLDGDISYLMPCEFRRIGGESVFRIEIAVLDPMKFLSNSLLNKKFLFGHPGKIIGYGILTNIDLDDKL